MNAAYITGISAFLPNAPVGNDEIERVLGLVGGLPSRTKKLVLKNNGIRSRYYAIDPETGRQTHTNARLAAEAIRDLVQRADLSVSEVSTLVCGTSSPDQWIPNHALMVHGELGSPPLEAVSTSGVCLSGVTALKYGYASVLAGISKNAVCAGSELSSSVLRASRFERVPTGSGRSTNPRTNPLVAFEREFLRWMLSDGAGAMLLTPRPRPQGLSLRIEWVEIVSFASELATCMYWGAAKREDGSLQGWREVGGMQDAWAAGHFNVAQDVRLLAREAGRTLIGRGLDLVRRRRGIAPGDVDWFLPHYSSDLFRDEVHDRLEEMDFAIPTEKWFTNLKDKGNTGAASIYIILEELFRSGRLEAGDRILCFVPESARFSVGYVLLTAVGPGATVV